MKTIDYRFWATDTNEWLECEGDSSTQENGLDYERIVSLRKGEFELSTGIKDKNGKLIFDGDILLLCGSRSLVNHKMVTCKGIVRFGKWTEENKYSSNDYFGFYIEEKSNFDGHLMFASLADYAKRKPNVGTGLKVIGNIHENPELLKTRKEK